MFVVGTVGHVDHGKSTLVQALTGIDPDRLPVEKQRGMTTDLGFAWLTLPSGRDVSVVDVPGHERYIKNMLAGSGSVDLALIVVAADDGPMTQTREHVAILELLEVPAAICVITKVDLVEPDFVDLVEAELEETLAGTPYAAAPRLRVSGRTGAGLPYFLRRIDESLDALTAKQDLGKPSLPIDRVFTVRGFGTVVTGTLVGGGLEVGQEVELQPGALKGRIRGLQRHGAAVSSAEPGTRMAVNLIGEAAEKAERGMVLALPGRTDVARIFDLHLRVPATVSATIKHNQGVTVLCGTAEAEGRLRLLDAETIEPDHGGWAQAVLDSPLPLNTGDRCIIRTPDETVAGGLVVALNPRRHRRNDAAVLANLELRLRGSTEDRLLQRLAAGPLARSAVATELGVPAAEAAAAVALLCEGGLALEAGARLYATAWLAAGATRMAAVTASFLEANPLRPAAPREHVRSSLKLDAAAFDAVLPFAIDRGQLQEAAERAITLPGYEVALTKAQQAEVAAFLGALVRGATNPPTENLPDPALLAYLVERGLVVDTGKGVVYDALVFAEMTGAVVAHLDASGSISLAEARDLFATTRKYAQPFLEQLDALKVTRRVGESRVLLHRPSTPSQPG